MIRQKPIIQTIGDITAEVVGNLGVITLDRPDALNALTLEMIRSISGVMRQWQDNDKIKAVMFKGAGGRAFCAGGDLKACYKVGMDFRRGKANLKVPALFFAEEYNFNKFILAYPKPTISFMNGITMGGGYGIAGNSKYRIVTNKTLFAMPEVAIGFFPDVGSLYHLPKFKRQMGRYIALTGNQIEAEDAYYAGVGEYFIGVEQEKELIKALSEGDKVDDVLSRFSFEPDNDAPMDGHSDKIEEVFVHDRVEDILSALEANGTAWAADIFEVMTSERAPASIYVTAEYFRRAVGKSAEEILDMDFHLAQCFIQRVDLYEGIRSVVIDKKYKPRWDPALLKNISDEDVNEYFTAGTYDLNDMGNI